ncbi:MAG: ATP-dependent sacrificial sulfur transferase LarE [Lachnospiraceae bacterium]|nr:ATP-dependent sacrificial sulfur transferase LarE [Lachnospiraceae bacterium]
MTELEGLSQEQKNKLDELKTYIARLGSLAVGFSGGADSALLLAVAHEVLKDRVIAVTAKDASVPEREIGDAVSFCKERGIRHIIIAVDPMKNEQYRKNGPDRCYFCKRGIFAEIMRTAKENGISFSAEGSNMDDLGDYRPGLKAVEELGVKSPLRHARLSKSDVRTISKAMGLPTWSKPAYACLASRFVYGEEITEEKLAMIDRAEQFLIENGFAEERVRLHGKIARIEVPEKDIPRLASDDMRTAVYEKFREIGFSFVTLDMRGYRTGSMNATLPGGNGKDI